MKIARIGIIFLMAVKVITGLFTPTTVHAASYSLSCDGVNDIAYRDTSTTWFPQATYSIEFKLYYGFATSSVSEKGIMAGANSSDPLSGGINWLIQRNGEVWRQYYGGYVADSSNTTMTQGNWYDVYIAHDNTNDKAYFGINGTVREVSDTMNHTTGTTPMVVCAGYAGYFNGYVDNLRISDTIRHTGNFTPTETPFTSDANTIALYNFDEGTGSTANDSVNNYDLTLGNGATWAAGYFVEPTPTPTPSPTPTPAIATASGFLNMPDALTQESVCSVWYDHESTGDIGSTGNAVYYVKNTGTGAITNVKTYGQFCDPSEGTPCGIGATSVQGGVTLDDYGADFPDFATWDTSSFGGGDIMGFYTGWWMERAYCTVGGVEYEANTPFGKTMTNPDFADLQSTSLSMKKQCVDFSLTIPLTRIGLAEDWILTMPNYFCIIYNWLVDLWVQIFGIDTSLIGTNVAAWQSELNSKAPFAYIAAVNDAIPDLASPSGIASLPDTEYSYSIPRYLNGEWTYWPFIEGTFHWSDFSPLQDEVTQARNAVSVLIWVLAIAGIFFSILQL